MTRRTTAILLLLGLAGCAGATYQDDEFAARIKAYYSESAVEEAGACRSPEIGAITKRKVLEAAGDRTVVQIRYTYYDPGVEGSADWTRVLTTDRPCTGTAERAFTLERKLAGSSVVAMSGPRRSKTD